MQGSSIRLPPNSASLLKSDWWRLVSQRCRVSGLPVVRSEKVPALAKTRLERGAKLDFAMTGTSAP